MEPSETIFDIASGQVDLWYVPWDSAVVGELESEYRAMLPAEELAGCDRFVFDEGRRQCLISRVLVRMVLSSYTGECHSVWQFSSNRYGKPVIAHPADCPLRFNLSHTTGLVVCAVCLGDEIGVDVEDRQRRLADHSIAKHYFAPEEVALLEAAPSEIRALKFLEFWTLKEAFLKAHGSGLSVPLNDFAMRLRPSRLPVIHFRNPALGDADQWQFIPWQLGERYQVAVAVQRPVEHPVALRIIETLPLRHTRVMQTLGRIGLEADNSCLS